MSEYKGIKGFQVQTRSTDPVPFAQELADNPYAGSWSSGGSLNQARNNLSGFGTQTSSLAVGGNNGGSYYGNAESYNGTAFTEVADLNQARRNTGSAGADNTAGITFGGIHPSLPSDSALNESWNGSAWTEVGDLTTARQLITGTGTQTAALGIAGGPNPGQTKVESWDGSSWTEIADVNTARNAGAASGLQPAALFFGGYTTTDVANTEVWNGSSWTEVSDLNTARAYLGGSDNTSTSALAFGGTIPPGRTANTESWDGSSWTEVNDLATARNSIGGTGANSTSALAFGGYNGSTGVSNTEEWSFSGVQPGDEASYSDAITGDFYYNSTTGQFKTVNTGGAPIGTWASGGNTNTARLGINGGAGTQTAGMIAGGNTSGGVTANTENYNGSTWTETGNLEAAKRDVGLAGSQTAGLAVNGGPAVNSVQHFNGSSWSEGGDYPTAQDRTGVFGTQTAAVAFGGRTSPGAQQSTTFEYDGSSWTSGGTFITTGYNQASAGTYNAGIAMGGYAPGDGSSQIAGYYDGTSWTSISNLNTARAETGWSGRGTQTASFIAGGTSPVSGKTEAWDGSSWTEVADLATSRNAMGSSGTVSAGFVAAGSIPGSPGFSQSTEEFTSVEFQIKTVTSS